MDDPASTLLLLLLPVLLLLSAGFSAAETAFFRLDAIWLRRLLRGGDDRAQRLARLLSARERVLSALLLSNTAVNVGFATILTMVLLTTRRESVPRHVIELLASLIATGLILFWGEILPKTFATRKPGPLALSLAAPAEWLSAGLRPVTFLADTASGLLLRALGRRPGRVPLHITSETIEAAVDLGVEQGALEEDDQSMIQGALDAAETKVREIMTPRPDVVWLPESATAGDVLKASAESGYSRVPLYRETIDDIAGIVYVRDLLPAVLSGSLNAPALDVARPAHLVPETKLVSELLHDMRERGIPLAIVLDEYGGTCGLVTLEDVVEEIVGDIADEFDAEEFTSLPVDGGFLLSGRYPIREANESLELSLPEPPDVDTVAGLVYTLAGRIPGIGDRVQAGEWVLTVEELKGSRILKVRAQRSEGQVAVTSEWPADRGWGR